MTEETYTRIAETYNHLVEDETNPLTVKFQECCSQYWKLSTTLPKEQWQTIDDCFRCFHQFYMAVASLVIENTK